MMDYRDWRTPSLREHRYRVLEGMRYPRGTAERDGTGRDGSAPCSALPCRVESSICTCRRF